MKRHLKFKLLVLCMVFSLAGTGQAMKVYWGEQGPGVIQRANLDGSVVREVIDTGQANWVGRIALDLVNDRLYWSSEALGTIFRTDLDGGNVEEIISTGLMLPNKITLDVPGGKMYWTDLAPTKFSGPISMGQTSKIW